MYTANGNMTTRRAFVDGNKLQRMSMKYYITFTSVGDGWRVGLDKV